MITRVRLMQTSARLMRNEQSPERVVKLVSCAQRATRLSLFPSHPTVPALPQGVCDKDTGVQPTHFRDPMSFMITLLLHIILAGRACDPRVSIAGVTFKAYRRRLHENVLWRGRRAAHVGRESTQRRRRCQRHRLCDPWAYSAGHNRRCTAFTHSLAPVGGTLRRAQARRVQGGQPRGADRRATRRPVRRGKRQAVRRSVYGYDLRRCLHAVVRSRSRFVLQRVQQEIRIREQIEFFGCSKEQEPRGKMWVRSDSL